MPLAIESGYQLALPCSTKQLNTLTVIYDMTVSSFYFITSTCRGIVQAKGKVRKII